jgi:peptidyl-prolyl cis-trans isomerase D
VAQVDGSGITQAEWDNAHQRNVERMRRQMPTVDVKLLDTPQMKRETLDGLVRERVLLAAAVKQNLLPSDERLQRLFKTDPQFRFAQPPTAL